MDPRETKIIVTALALLALASCATQQTFELPPIGVRSSSQVGSGVDLDVEVIDSRNPKPAGYKTAPEMPDYIRHAFTSNLAAHGFAMKSGGAKLSIEILEADLFTDRGFWTNSAKGAVRIQCAVSAGGQRYVRVYESNARTRYAVDERAYPQALRIAVTEALDKFLADQHVFRTLGAMP